MSHAILPTAIISLVLCAAYASVFVAWMLIPAVSDELLRAEIGYAGGTALLAVTLAALYRSDTRRLQARAMS